MLKASFAPSAFAAVCLIAAGAAAQSQRPGLPEGEGKQLVQDNCTACHQHNQIQNSSGYTRDGWSQLIQTMLPIGGTPELAAMSDYLAAHFPVNARRQPKLMPGTASVTFKEWLSPTLGQRTRDPVEAPDGSIWWAGQWSDSVGRVDPKTGEIKEYDLPTDAKPHTVTADRDGNIWYTGNGNGTIGKLDPKTGQITVYKMPDPAARDPHSMIVDSKGTVFFTLQQSNMIGRLIPSTGEIKLVKPQTANTRPYGIKLDADETPWVASNGSNRLIRVDPATMELREYPLPIPATTVRRLDIAEDGMIWYVNSSQGRLGRLDPKTGEVKEWPSPSGAKSHPYAIAVLDGVVWYNESGQRPDALVRFDPKSESFQSWPIPSGDIYAGIIRHMRTTKDGKLLIHQSSTARVLVVTPSPAGPVATQ
jgi:virginiamycin B lyase